VKPIRYWRIVGETEQGAFCFFDPSNEKIFIRDLTVAEKDERIRESGSVSASKAEAGTLRQMLLNNHKKEVPF